jgi:hypothetical protein
MDPVAAWREACVALDEGRLEDASILLDGLWFWLSRGGFTTADIPGLEEVEGLLRGLQLVGFQLAGRRR